MKSPRARVKTKSETGERREKIFFSLPFLCSRFARKSHSVVVINRFKKYLYLKQNPTVLRSCKVVPLCKNINHVTHKEVSLR